MPRTLIITIYADSPSLGNIDELPQILQTVAEQYAEFKYPKGLNIQDSHNNIIGHWTIDWHNINDDCDASDIDIY